MPVLPIANSARSKLRPKSGPSGPTPYKAVWSRYLHIYLDATVRQRVGDYCGNLDALAGFCRNVGHFKRSAIRDIGYIPSSGEVW